MTSERSATRSVSGSFAAGTATSASSAARDRELIFDRLFPVLLWLTAPLLGLALATVTARAGWQATAVEAMFMAPLGAAALLHFVLRTRLGWHAARGVAGSPRRQPAPLREDRDAALEELRTLREEREAMIAEVRATAHDLRAPLLTVRTYLELLAEGAFGALPAEARQAATEAGRAAERAQTVAADALGSGVRRCETVELRDVLDEVVAGLRAQIAASQAQIEVDALPAVAGDRDALYRVFANLIENSLKYARPERPPRVAVWAESHGSRCSIAVRDWGIGIPSEEQGGVFTRGVRAQNSDGAAGSGIGLATVSRLVQLHGGEVWVDPNVTDGTCVRVSLPSAA